MSVGLNCLVQTTWRFWTLVQLICLSVEKREFDTSPSPLSQFAPAAVTPCGSHDCGLAFCEPCDADAIATTLAAASTMATARSGYFRMRPLPPFDAGLPS